MNREFEQHLARALEKFLIVPFEEPEIGSAEWFTLQEMDEEPLNPPRYFIYDRESEIAHLKKE